MRGNMTQRPGMGHNRPPLDKRMHWSGFYPARTYRAVNERPHDMTAWDGALSEVHPEWEWACGRRH